MRYRLIRALILLVMSAFVSTASAADKLRIGKAVPFAWTFTPIDVGIEAGIFAKHGLELTVTGFAGDARMQQGLVSDSIDMSLGSGPGMGFLAKGVPAKAVAAMAGAPMNMSMVVSYDSPIKTLDDIKGKKIGITTVGSLTDWLLKRVRRGQEVGADGRDGGDGRRHGFHQGRAQDRADRRRRDRARIGLCAGGGEGMAGGVAARALCAAISTPT